MASPTPRSLGGNRPPPLRVTAASGGRGGGGGGGGDRACNRILNGYMYIYSSYVYYYMNNVDLQM